MKKIAIPTENGRVAAHFGRCPEYTLFQTAEGEVINKEVIDNPGHRPGFLPRFLAEQGVDCIIAGGMGRKAVNLFRENEIEVLTGVEGEVDSSIQAFLTDELEVRGNICDHSETDGRHHTQGGSHGCHS